MASALMASSAAVAVGSTAAMAATSKPAAQSNVVSAFNGLKSAVQFPSRRSNAEWEHKTSSNGSRVQCMQVWNPYNNKKFETLSYLPPLSPEGLLKEIDYLLNNGWVPCLEFDEDGYVSRTNNRSPGYYDGRYWVMWKLPMFGCTDSSQVAAEIKECAKAYPKAFIRVIGFDNVRQVQCISFIVHKPEY
ncbi:ribulose bisphosphate carboxylase small subunit [Salmonella sp. NW1009]|uniref:ribulose bisphosphate carboxylase small subunit n=1 Tax=Salmonella sp. NW1009 TaxID=2947445 RepID=UPI003F476365|eukprot:Gb_00380 [translate_table: standard]